MALLKILAGALALALLVPAVALSDPHLQIVVGHRQRPIIQRERQPHRSDLALLKTGRQGRADGAQTGAALPDDGAVHFARHRGRFGPRTIRVRKDVEVRQAEIPHPRTG